MLYLVIGCRCLIGLVFAVAATSKLRNAEAFGEFAESVRALRLPHDRPVAAVVAGGEALIAVLMVAPRPFALAGFVLAAVLLSAFAVAIVDRRRRGIRARCRCFGTGRAELGPVHAARNTGLAVVAGLAAAGLAAGPPPAAHPGGLAVAVAAGAVVALLTITLDDLMALFRMEASR